MNTVTNLFIVTMLSVVAAPLSIFADYQSNPSSGLNSTNRQNQNYNTPDQYNNKSYQTDKNGERVIIQRTNNSYDHSNQNMTQDHAVYGHQDSADVQHPVYEYRLGKDGKWYDTKDDQPHPATQNGQPDSHPLTPINTSSDQRMMNPSNASTPTNSSMMKK